MLLGRYLTLLVGYSLLPHNFIFKSPVSFFCLDLKITISVFCTLNEILFAFNQLARCFKSVLTSLFRFFFFFFWLSYWEIIDSWYQQNGELYKILLLDSSHLYVINIEGALEQILEGHHILWQQDQMKIHL